VSERGSAHFVENAAVPNRRGHRCGDGRWNIITCDFRRISKGNLGGLVRPLRRDTGVTDPLQLKQLRLVDGMKVAKNAYLHD